MLAIDIFPPSQAGMAAWFQANYATTPPWITLDLALSAAPQGQPWRIGAVPDRHSGTLVAHTAELSLMCRMAQAVIAAGLVLSRAIVCNVVPDAQVADIIACVTMACPSCR